MVGKIFLFVFIFIVIGSLIFLYVSVPFKEVIFEADIEEDNFSLVSGTDMQFYPNMRFAEKDITYKISEECILEKQNEMEQAFEIIENLTVLNFEAVESNEDITVSCDETERLNEGLFIAGEGGPTNVTASGNFAVISKGDILLIRNSDCPNPNIAIHELLHVLGFDHSENPNNIMYKITDCDQTIGEDVVNLLNELYSIPSDPDLVFKNVSASIDNGKLDLNIVIANEGLGDAQNAVIKITSGDYLIKELNIGSLRVGKGLMIESGNIIVLKKFEEIEMTIETEFSEISKENNKINLRVKSEN